MKTSITKFFDQPLIPPEKIRLGYRASLLVSAMMLQAANSVPAQKVIVQWLEGHHTKIRTRKSKRIIIIEIPRKEFIRSCI
jgi:hypothetical protein